MTGLRAVAGELAATALRTVRAEYPYDLRVLYTAPGAAPERPRDRHPAFYGSYDWHSAVEMHWVLLRLLRRFPDEVDTGAVRAVLDEHLTPGALATETAHHRANPGAQRPYGWGWALTLHEEAAAWPGAAPWTAALQPLADHFLDALAAWLPRAPYPVRHGVHPNSAFGLVRSLPSARRRAADGDDRALSAVEDAARRWFTDDADAPVRWEPSGADFLSPVLTEAVLMAEVLPADEFGPWLARYLPGLADRPLFEPAVVADSSDGQTAHLHGLNLSRAWALRRLAAHAPAARELLLDTARRHAEPELAEVSGSDYVVEHWLAAYALLYLDEDL
ncbi:DUF2891 domain-containing protein [Blastococcus sp. SYSU D00669]